MDDYTHEILSDGQTTITNYLLANYHRIGVSSEELFIYILIKGQHTMTVPMPEIDHLQVQTGYHKQRLFDIFHKMIEKKLTKITQVSNDGHQVDAYDFTPMYEKLSLLKPAVTRKKATTAESANPVSESDRQTVFETIEKEFGRTLSPFEMEMISQWLDIDHFEPTVIRLALKEAVLSQVYNLKYMDRILGNWQHNKLRSPQQIQTYLQKRNQSNRKTDSPDDHYDGPEIPFIDLTKQ